MKGRSREGEKKKIPHYKTINDGKFVKKFKDFRIWNAGMWAK